MEVKFNVNTLDKDTGILYPASDDFVSVSDAFAERLKATKRHDDYEFSGSVKKSKEDGGKVKDLEAKVKELEDKLAASGDDTEAEAKLTELQSKFDELTATNEELTKSIEAKDAEIAALYEENGKLTELTKAAK